MIKYKSALALLIAFHASLGVAASTGMKFISTAGDYIGGGTTQTYLPPEASITATGSAGVVSVSVSDESHWWYLDFASPTNRSLKKAKYADAARYPFNSPLAPGMSVYGDGRGCNTLKGWFRVRQYELDESGNVAKLAIDFLQNCEVTGPPLYGAVRVNSDFELHVPDTAAVAGADFTILGGEKGKLDGTQSFSRKHAPLSYAWTQTDGPAVVLDDPHAKAPRFTAPAVGDEGASLRFELVVTDAQGGTARDNVVVRVESANAARTQVSFSGDEGDYITQGLRYRFDTRNASIQFSRNYDGGVSVSINGESWWTIDTAVPMGQVYREGVYRKAQRFPFQDEKSPGLDLSGDGRGCNTLTGKFTVYEAKFDDRGEPKRLDIGFVQHCEGVEAAARGEILLNAVPHELAASRLRAARLRFGDE